MTGCATPDYSPVPPPNPDPPHGGVMQPRPALVGAQVDRVVAWKYPDAAYSNAYRWSLESTANFVTWVTVTNYPLGYSDDAWATNDWRPQMYYRMHGRL